MLPLVRKEHIKELINVNKSVSVTDLAQKFNLTEETIRKDLDQLEKEGYLKRTYGGAYISDGVENEVDIQLREHIHTKGKERMAIACSKLINSGDSIFLDASTTALYIAQQLDNKNLTITTNSIKIASFLASKKNINVVLLGGNLHDQTLSLLGKQAEQNINNYYFDKSFISCRFLNRQHGITDSNEQQAEIRRLAVHRANTAFLVADYTKFDRTAFKKICSFEDINHLVTDHALSKDWKSLLTNHQIIYQETT